MDGISGNLPKQSSYQNVHEKALEQLVKDAEKKVDEPPKAEPIKLGEKDTLLWEANTRMNIALEKMADQPDKMKVLKQLMRNLHHRDQEHRYKTVVAIHNLGLEHELIAFALMASMYNTGNDQPAFLEALVRMLTTYMNDSDVYYVASVIRSFIARADAFSNELKQEIVKTIYEYQLPTHPSAEVREVAKKLMQRFSGLRDKGVEEKPVRKSELAKVPFPEIKLGPPAVPPSIAQVQVQLYSRRNTDAELELLHQEILKFMGLTGIWASMLLNYPEIFYRYYLVQYLLYVAAIGQGEGETLGPGHLTGLAVVTHPSASMDKFRGNLRVRMVDPDVTERIRLYYDMFFTLFEEGFTEIIAILPDYENWHAGYYAKHAAKQMQHPISLVDSKTYGLGLGMIVSEMIKDLEQKTHITDVQGHLNGLLSQLKYWIIPESGEQLNDYYWYKRLLKEVRHQDPIPSRHVPLIRCFEPMAIEKFAPSMQHLEKYLVKTLRDMKKGGFQPRHIRIEHQDEFPLAKALGTALAETFTDSDVRVGHCNAYLNTALGPHISVALI